MQQINNNESIALYVHIPWCVKKCPYCDFNSHTVRQEPPFGDYIEALINNLLTYPEEVRQKRISSIFFGGGTPSLMPIKWYEVFFNRIKNILNLAPDIEITLECNPGTIERDNFKDYASVGINRISLGVQSFNDDMLTKLGRIHNVEHVEKCIDELKKSSIKNFNIDIMFGLPSQTLDMAMEDLSKAIVHKPQHISWYNLNIEPDTYFFKHPPKLPDEDRIIEIMQHGTQKLISSGYKHYEISAFGMKNFQCAHNLNYWLFGDYIGIGAGAHGKYTINNEVFRTTNTKSPTGFIKEQGKYISKNLISHKDLPFEFMLNAARLIDGFEIDNFKIKTGKDHNWLVKHLANSIKNNLCSVDSTKFLLTTKGNMLLNSILHELI